MMAMLAATFALSVLTYHFVEVRGRRFMRARFGTRVPAAEAAAVR